MYQEWYVTRLILKKFYHLILEIQITANPMSLNKELFCESSWDLTR